MKIILTILFLTIKSKLIAEFWLSSPSDSILAARSYGYEMIIEYHSLLLLINININIQVINHDRMHQYQSIAKFIFKYLPSLS